MEITQTPAGYVLAVSTGDAPTCDVDIELDGPLLIVRASGPTPHERRFLLLAGLDPESITARRADGSLEVVVARTQSRPHHVPVKSGFSSVDATPC